MNDRFERKSYKNRNRNQNYKRTLCVVGSIDESARYSGCTKYMTCDIRNFYSFDDFGNGTVVFGNGEEGNILGIGQIDITVYLQWIKFIMFTI